jgi:hypothetical protein
MSLPTELCSRGHDNAYSNFYFKVIKTHKKLYYYLMKLFFTFLYNLYIVSFFFTKLLRIIFLLFLFCSFFVSCMFIENLVTLVCYNPSLIYFFVVLIFWKEKMCAIKLKFIGGLKLRYNIFKKRYKEDKMQKCIIQC